MNLNELVLRLRTPPAKGTHEIVRGPDGMNHLAIIVMARDVPENGVNVREFSFHLWCGISSVKATDLEVVPPDECVTALPVLPTGKYK